MTLGTVILTKEERSLLAEIFYIIIKANEEKHNRAVIPLEHRNGPLRGQRNEIGEMIEIIRNKIL